MHALIDAALSRRTVCLILLAMMLWGGWSSYQTIPKERDPDVQIPLVYLVVPLQGISASDAEKRLAKPLERALRSVKGVKKIVSYSSLGSSSVMLEFYAGYPIQKALQDVRDKVQEERRNLPQEIDEPSIHEVNLGEMPVISVLLKGSIAERGLGRLASDLKSAIENIPSVLKVQMTGEQKKQVNIVLDPRRLEQHQLSLGAMKGIVEGNNRLIAGGLLRSPTSTEAVKLPSLLDRPEDFLSLPIKVKGDQLIPLQDIATVRYGFQDRDSIGRIGGEPGIILDISKRSGSNVVQVIEAVKSTVAEISKQWPPHMSANFYQDQSKEVANILQDLENNIVFSVLLAMIPVMLTMNLRSGFLVGLSVPASFVFGILVLAFLHYSLNIVVLFSLILSVGMLVDATIVVTEYADRLLQQGASRLEAYSHAAKRMALPVISGATTSMIVFVPLLFWPGIVGEFMSYMPITILVTVTGSLLVAFIFIPALGSLLGKETKSHLRLAGDTAGPMEETVSVEGWSARYRDWLGVVLRFPGWFVLAITAVLILVIAFYSIFGPGVEFFPMIEPERAEVQLRSSGDYSLEQKDRMVRKIEAVVAGFHPGVVEHYYSEVLSDGTFNSQSDKAVIGTVYMEFSDWKNREKATVFLEKLRRLIVPMPGVEVQVQSERGGPNNGAPIQIRVAGHDGASLRAGVGRVKAWMAKRPGLINVIDDGDPPQKEWNFTFHRREAARYGVDLDTIGSHMRMFTEGFLITKIYPDDTEDEVEVRLLVPESMRTMTALMASRVQTHQETSVPLRTVLSVVPKQREGVIMRRAGFREMTVFADVAEGVLADNEIIEFSRWQATESWPSDLHLSFGGDRENQDETKDFLGMAFGLALFAMAMLMTLQFNSLYKMLIIMSAVFLSTVGVLLGLLLTYQPFGIVMCGVGIIALAGTVVNNNIIFIDTYDEYAPSASSLVGVLKRTGAERLRPIMLTAGTGVLGLLPMVFGVNIDFIAWEVTVGAPASQWWRQLSTTIAGGLSFATVLTLFYTPCLLVLGHRVQCFVARHFSGWVAAPSLPERLVGE